MLGIIIMAIIGRKFYQLANRFEQPNSWLYAVLSIVAYYAGSILIGGIIVIGVIEFGMGDSIENFSDTGLNFILMPFGFLTVYLLYRFLEKRWEKAFVPIGNEIDDIGVSEDESNPA